MYKRTQTRALKVGKLPIGGGAPVSVQSMANVDPHDAVALLEQIRACAEVGCDLFRLTVPDLAAATTLAEVKKSSPIPLVADIHFDYRCALAAIEAGVDALRLNPGNIGGRAQVQAVARAAKAKGTPIRIGVNGGSLDVGARRPRPDELVAAALEHVKLLEDEDFHAIVISAKASSVSETLEVYRLLAERTDCPLHLGVTEAGTFLPGTVRNSVALGILLSEGIGDTIRVSLTAKPEKEVRVGVEILRSLALRSPGPSITSCPTCGRTQVDLIGIATKVENALETLAKDGMKLPHVAVMGCVVNGPGEAKGADIALCGGKDEFLVYVKGRLACRVPEADAVRKVMEYAVSL